MDIDLLGYVVRQLRAMPRSEWAGVADEADVPQKSLEKIVYGVHKNPSAIRVQRIANALMNKQPANSRQVDATA